MNQNKLTLELEQLEEEEHNHAIEIFTLLLIIVDEMGIEVENLISLWSAKYGIDGVLTQRHLRKSFTKSELKEFNRKYSRKYKRLSRASALKIAITYIAFKAYQKSSSLFKKLGIDIGDFEKNAFDKLFDQKFKFGIDDVLNRTWGADDSFYDYRLRAHFEKYAFNANKIVQRAIYRETPINDVLPDVMKRTDSLNKALKRLLLSEAVAFSSGIRKGIFNDLGIKYYIFYAKLDERTCDECGALHGTKFPISAFEIGVTASPIHGHCRCFEVPYIEE